MEISANGSENVTITKPNEFVCNMQSFAIAGKTCIEVKDSKHISDKTMFQINGFIILLTYIVHIQRKFEFFTVIIDLMILALK